MEIRSANIWIKLREQGFTRFVITSTVRSFLIAGLLLMATNFILGAEATLANTLQTLLTILVSLGVSFTLIWLYVKHKYQSQSV